MQEAYAIAMQNLKKSAKRGQKNYNQRAWSSTLEPGDHILVRNLTPRGAPGKLRSYWEDTVHVVKERKDDGSPVYVVEPFQGAGRRRVLHRNLLLPCPYLVEEPDVHEPNLKKKSNEPLEEENIEKGQNIEREMEAPIIESEDEKSDAGTRNDRPKRVRQPRRVYTYDQLGEPTFQQLKICPVGVKWSTGTSCDLSAGSSFMYPFYHC